MKIAKKCVSGAICLLFLSSAWKSSAMAQNDMEEVFDKNGRFFISAGLETMDGETTYSIGFPITLPNGVTYGGYFPISELQWPLDIELAKVKTGFKAAENFDIHAGIKKNITDPDSNMEDRDWLTFSQPSRLDIYSDSFVSDFSALMLDVEMQWTFARTSHFAVYTGAGFLYQSFEYDVKLIRQYSPSGLPGFDVTGDDRVGITYDIEYYVPYLLIGMDLSPAKDFTIAGKLGYSPYAWARDEDHHLLRENGGKVAEGDMDGYAIFVDLSARYNFFQNFFAEVGGTITRIEVKGTQDQRYVLTGPIAEVDMESVSDQYIAYFNIGFTF